VNRHRFHRETGRVGYLEAARCWRKTAVHRAALVSATVPALSALSAARVLEGELELLLLAEKGLDKRPAGK
jgi:hypothetical protein